MTAEHDAALAARIREMYPLASDLFAGAAIDAYGEAGRLSSEDIVDFAHPHELHRALLARRYLPLALVAAEADLFLRRPAPDPGSGF